MYSMDTVNPRQLMKLHLDSYYYIHTYLNASFLKGNAVRAECHVTVFTDLTFFLHIHYSTNTAVAKILDKQLVCLSSSSNNVDFC